MHYLTDVEYASGYCLRLRFEDGHARQVNLKNHLEGEMFEPLRDLHLFRSARLNADIDTVVWDNGADMSPDFLYEISIPIVDQSMGRVAEDSSPYDSN